MPARSLALLLLASIPTLAGCAAEVIDDAELGADELDNWDDGPSFDPPVVDRCNSCGGGNPCPECRLDYNTATQSTPTTTTPMSAYRLRLNIPESLRTCTRAELTWRTSTATSGPVPSTSLSSLGAVGFSTTSTVLPQILAWPQVPVISSTSAARRPLSTEYFIDLICNRVGTACSAAEVSQQLRYRMRLGEAWLGTGG